MSEQEDVKYFVLRPMYNQIAIPLEDATKLLEALQNAVEIKGDYTIAPVSNNAITFELSSKLGLKARELEKLATS